MSKKKTIIGRPPSAEPTERVSMRPTVKELNKVRAIGKERSWSLSHACLEIFRKGLKVFK